MLASKSLCQSGTGGYGAGAGNQGEIEAPQLVDAIARRGKSFSEVGFV